MRCPAPWRGQARLAKRAAEQGGRPRAAAAPMAPGTRRILQHRGTSSPRAACPASFNNHPYCRPLLSVALVGTHWLPAIVQDQRIAGHGALHKALGIQRLYAACEALPWTPGRRHSA